jgi:hypothetical protein
VETQSGNLGSHLITRRRAFAAVIIAFVISRSLYLYPGSRFTLNLYMMQFLDPAILTANYWQSLFYLHSQPPLMNLILGAALKAFPSFLSITLVLQVVFAAMGLAITLMMLSLALDLGVPVWLALIATLLFEVGPATLMYENWFYDTYPTIFFLCLSAFSLHRFVSRGTLGWGIAFIAAMALPVLANSSFQIVWFIAAGLLLWFAARQELRRLVSCFVVLLVLLLVLYVKNAIVFGVFTTSSWFGMNLSTMTTFQLPLEQRDALVKSKQLSPLALGTPFPALPPTGSPPTGIPALDQIIKQTWPAEPNFNNIGYVGLSRTDFHDAMWVLRNRPASYLRGLAVAAESYFQPAGDVGDVFRYQKKGLDGWIFVYDLPLATVHTPLGYIRNTISAEDYVGFRISIVLFVSLTLLSFWAVVRSARIMCRGAATPEEVTFLFIAMTVLYVSFTGIAFNCGENYRLRFVADPFYAILACLALTKLLRPRATEPA